MRHLIVLSAIMTLSLSALALPDWVDTSRDNGSDHCTDWVKQRGISCQFAGSGGAWSWRRTCSDWQRTCSARNRNVCDEELFCGPPKLDPNVLIGHCTDWYLHRGTRCTDEGTGRLEQRYSRACVKGNVPRIRCGDYVPPF